MNIFIFIFIAVVGVISAQESEIEVAEDFQMNIEYRLEKLETQWVNRGKIVFTQKDATKYKSKISVKNSHLTDELMSQIQRECKLKGTYYIRFTSAKNIFYSSGDPVLSLY